MVPDELVVHIDDSDIVKPDGHKFEAMGLVRDGSKSTDARNVYEKGYCVTFSAMERGASLFGKATFVMDRGYDDNKMFLKLDSLEQDYVIRLAQSVYSTMKLPKKSVRIPHFQQGNFPIKSGTY